jgi:hypothetical protein
MTRIRLDDDRPPYPELAHAVLALLEMLDRLTVSLICQESGPIPAVRILLGAPAQTPETLDG